MAGATLDTFTGGCLKSPGSGGPLKKLRLDQPPVQPHTMHLHPRRCAAASAIVTCGLGQRGLCTVVFAGCGTKKTNSTTPHVEVYQHMLMHMQVSCTHDDANIHMHARLYQPMQLSLYTCTYTYVVSVLIVFAPLISSTRIDVPLPSSYPCMHRMS